MASAIETGDSLLVLPEEVEEAVVQWLSDNLEKPAVQYRTVIAKDDMWTLWREKYSGDQWINLKKPDDCEPFTGNIIMPTIDTTKGIALQSPSVVEFVPGDPDDEEFASDVTAVVGDYLWNVRKARFKLGVAFVEGGVIGTAWAKTYWNPALEGGDGDVDFMVLPAEEVWVDPACTGVNDWNFVIHAPRRPLIEVKYDDVNYNKRRLDVQSDQAINEGQKKNTPEEQMDLVTVKEHWVRGAYLKAMLNEVPGVERFIDDDGMKYGVVITVASNLVVKFISHPWKCERFPFQRFVYYLPDGNQRIYGHGEVEYLVDVQDHSNARMTQMLNQASLISNQQWLVSNLIVVDDEELNNRSGQIIHVEGAPDLVRRIEPTGISGSLFDIQSLLMRFQEIISGMYEVNRGDIPGSLRAGVAIQALQRGGEGRTRQKMDNFDDFVADIGMGMADIMAVMYTEDRIFRVIGSSEDVAENELPQEPLPPEESEEQMNKYETGPKSRKVAINAKKFWRDGKRIGLDARAQVGLQLRSTQEQLQQDVELLNAGVVDAQYVIENNRIRGKERLLARLFQLAQAQEVEAAAALPPGEEEAQMAQLAPTPDEQAQIDQTIEMLLAKISQLEDQGVIPPGLAEKTAQEIQAEQASGGTGEQALQRALEEIEMYTGGGQQAVFGTQPVAPGAPQV